MSDRIANILVLCEDLQQQNLIRRYLVVCRHHLRSIRFLPLTPTGSGEAYVRRELPGLVTQCRGIVGKRTQCLLIAMVDADARTVVDRMHALLRGLDDAGVERPTAAEPIVLLIPRRHVETWIRALLGTNVDEDTDYKRPEPTPSEIVRAACSLFDWTRPNAQPGPSCPPSLHRSIPEWKKIP